MAKKLIKIGNAGGYWGDDPSALYRQVHGGRLDYISMDFLAEITMSIMQKQRSHQPDLGYARDFLPMIESVLKKILEDKTKIITNAGGVNPLACAREVQKIARKLGLNPKIAIVHGDDILTQVKDLQSKGCEFRNMETNESFDQVNDRLEAANIYFGATPVVEALKWDPDILITGRVTDTGITVAAMIHEFGWSLNDWNKIASGIVAGHIIECGSQSTGGNFTDWHLVKSYDQIGFPIVEVEDNGDFVVTKHKGSGGLVSVDTIREQLVYEMGHPKAYITPDVVADFSSIQLKSDGADRVRISGVKGFEPTPLYKVSMAYRDGFKCLGTIAISGPNARKKAEMFADIFWKRVATKFAATETEYYGWNACHRSVGWKDDGNEIILRLGARDQDEKKLRHLGKIIPSLILGGPAGVCVLGGAPKPTEVISYWPALMPKSVIKPKIALLKMDDSIEERSIDNVPNGKFIPQDVDTQSATSAKANVQTLKMEHDDANAVPLERICLARSGDKGDTANIGVLARSPEAFKFLCEYLTAQRVKDYFQELCHGKVTRYVLQNLNGLNFLLEESLGGGGTLTLRADAQGKMFAQGLIRQKAVIPKSVLDSVRS